MSRAQPAESARSRRESSVVGLRNLTLAAASSRASGSPARRQQIAATASAFDASSRKPGDDARARSTNRRPEGEARTSSFRGERVEAGSASGLTWYSRSPLTRSGARLVTSTVRFGQPSIVPSTSGAASTTCSKLSSKDRKSTRLNSSHANISYAVFCLKKKRRSAVYLDDDS